jgi:hypothetical protein
MTPPARPSALALALALVALSGCGLAPSTGTEVSVTPAPVPTDDPAAPAPAPVTVTVNASGLPAAGALARAHASALAATSFALDRRRVRRAADGTLIGSVTTNGTFAAGLDRYRFERVVVAPPGVDRAARFADGERAYARYGDGARVLDALPRDALGFDPTARRDVARAFAALNTTVVDARTVAGRRAFVVESTGVADRTALAALTSVEASNASLSAVVSPEGLVYRLTLRYTAADDGVTVELAVRFSAVGAAPVERPEWALPRTRVALSPPPRAIDGPGGEAVAAPDPVTRGAPGAPAAVGG